MKRRTAAALTTVLLVLAACGGADDGDDAGATDPDTSTSDTTEETTTTTEAVEEEPNPDPGSATPSPIGNRIFGAPEQNPKTDATECTAMAGVLVAAQELDPPPGFELVTDPSQLNIEFTDGDNAQAVDFTPEELDVLRADGFELYVANDPIINLETLVGDEFHYVNVFGVGGHVFFLPGAGARPQVEGEPVTHTGDPEGTLGVVDVGLHTAEDASEIGGVRVVDPALDLEGVNTPPALRGHATFIASLVRQVDSGPEVVMTAARLGNHAISARSIDEGTLTIGTTAGFNLYVAIKRLADDLAGTNAPLSLSLGAEPCIDAFLLTAAVDYWTETVGGDIYAGTGNGGASDALAPASFPNVIAVGAAGWNSSPAKFSNKDGSSQSIMYGPGVCVVGLRFSEQPYAWSGTSFATPLVAAGATDYAAINQQNGSQLDSATRADCEQQLDP